MRNELAALYERSKAADFGLRADEFAVMLAEIAEAALPADVRETERYAFYESLHLQDLMLARACLRGEEKAWETLVALYRYKLFAMASGISRNEGVARELADSLFAALFGMRGRRSSKLASYQGRASLEQWLRAVLAREYVDRFRAERKFVPLEDTRPQVSTAPAKETQETNALVAKALDAALRELTHEERFLLAGAYLDGRSRTELGRILGVHETTIGRRIEKTLKIVRRRTLRQLRSLGVGLAAAEKLLECDVQELEVDVRNRLLVVREA